LYGRVSSGELLALGALAIPLRRHLFRAMMPVIYGKLRLHGGDIEGTGARYITESLASHGANRHMAIAGLRSA
jgi:hypothetical protein